jgi:hypothetical protein
MVNGSGSSAASPSTDGPAGHAVAGVDHHPQRPDRPQVDQGPQVGGVRGEDVPADDPVLAAGGAGPGDPPVQQPLGQLADPGQAGVLPDRLGPGPAQLDPVVLGRVVARGEHRAGQVEAAGGVVQQIGGAETGVHHPGPGGAHPIGESCRQAGRRLAHVIGDHHGAGRFAGLPQRQHEGGADGAGHVLVQLLRYEAADVVGLDNAVQRDSATDVGHSEEPTGAPDQAGGMTRK